MEVRLDRRGVAQRCWWMGCRRREWTAIKQVLAQGCAWCLHDPPVVLAIMRPGGFRGYLRGMAIPDIFEVRRSELAAAMEQLRLAASQVVEVPAAQRPR
jgi:hypothetical protein